AYMAAFALVLTRALPKVQAEEPEGDLTPRGILRRHGVIYRSPFISAPATGWLFYTLSYVSILTLLPPFIAPQIRAFVIGTMPLVSIVSSLALGVWLLRRISAVRLMQLGFLAAALMALLLAALPGNPAVCLALAAALGLVQGAGFAAVPELNDAADTRAQANGALAQTGNIGNTLGTPLILMVISLGGHSAMMLTIALILGGGAIGQWALARRRAAYG
ncbi:MAG: MFS transporter, partial [Alphaproteobacteria bacterium]|nr:MFS transporter [Alphaproteobacteria bacterium]